MTERVAAPAEIGRDHGRGTVVLFGVCILIVVLVVGRVAWRAATGTSAGGSGSAAGDPFRGPVPVAVPAAATTAREMSDLAPTGTSDATVAVPAPAPRPAPDVAKDAADDPFGSRAARTPHPAAGLPEPTTCRRDLAPKPRLDAATESEWAATSSAISATGPGLEVIRAVSGAYPTSARAYGANRGVESLVEALERRGPVDGFGLRVGDTDADGRREFLDPWGRPLVYFSHDDYGTSQDVTGIGAVGARDRWIGDRRTWQAEQRFQLFSAGPDGKDDRGGRDDVNSWVSR